MKLRVWELPGGEASPLHREAAVAENGAFEIAGLKPGEYLFSIGFCDVGQWFSLLRVEYRGESNTSTTALAAAPYRDRFPITVGKKGLTGVRVVLAYKSGSIKIHVDIEIGELRPGAQLMALITDGHGTTWQAFEPNRDFTYEGLEPGEYEIEIRDDSSTITEKKTVRVARGDTLVSFEVDAGKTRPMY